MTDEYTKGQNDMIALIKEIYYILYRSNLAIITTETRLSLVTDGKL